MGLESTDVIRSLKRYLALLLQDADPTIDWDLRIEATEDAERPSGLIIPTPVATNSGSAYVRETRRDIDVFLYPAPLMAPEKGIVDTAMSARLKAERTAQLVQQRLFQGFKLGSYVAKPMRLPVYDYDGVDYDVPVQENALRYSIPMTFGTQVQVRPDPEDTRLFTIFITFALVWSVDGDLSRFDGAVLQDVRRQYRPG